MDCTFYLYLFEHKNKDELKAETQFLDFSTNYQRSNFTFSHHFSGNDYIILLVYEGMSWEYAGMSFCLFFSPCCQSQRGRLWASETYRKMWQDFHPPLSGFLNKSKSHLSIFVFEGGRENLRAEPWGKHRPSAILLLLVLEDKPSPLFLSAYTGRPPTALYYRDVFCLLIWSIWMENVCICLFAFICFI